VQVPAEVLAQMLGCRQTNLRQNYGDALMPCADRGLYLLESVPRAVERLRARRGRGGRSSAEEENYLALRNEKIKDETLRIRLASRDYVAKLKQHARDEVIDELSDLAVRLREEVRVLPAELIEAHNRWVSDLADRLAALADRSAQVTDEDRDALEDLRHDE
jgi:hypothetical protein